jgi:hypothetical protein
MKYLVKHYAGGYQVFEQDGDSEKLIASFHKDPETSTGAKSPAQLRAEEYCDFLNHKDLEGDFLLDLNGD